MNDDIYYSYKNLLKIGFDFQNEIIRVGDIDKVNNKYKNDLLLAVVDFFKTTGCDEAAEYVDLMTEPDFDE